MGLWQMRRPVWGHRVSYFTDSSKGGPSEHVTFEHRADKPEQQSRSHPGRRYCRPRHCKGSANHFNQGMYESSPHFMPVYSADAQKGSDALSLPPCPILPSGFQLSAIYHNLKLLLGKFQNCRMCKLQILCHSEQYDDIFLCSSMLTTTTTKSCWDFEISRETQTFLLAWTLYNTYIYQNIIWYPMNICNFHEPVFKDIGNNRIEEVWWCLWFQASTEES